MSLISHSAAVITAFPATTRVEGCVHWRATQQSLSGGELRRTVSRHPQDPHRRVRQGRGPLSNHGRRSPEIVRGEAHDMPAAPFQPPVSRSITSEGGSLSVDVVPVVLAPEHVVRIGEISPGQDMTDLVADRYGGPQPRDAAVDKNQSHLGFRRRIDTEPREPDPLAGLSDPTSPGQPMQSLVQLVERAMAVAKRAVKKLDDQQPRERRPGEIDQSARNRRIGLSIDDDDCGRLEHRCGAAASRLAADACPRPGR